MELNSILCAKVACALAVTSVVTGCATFDPMDTIAMQPKRGDGVLFVQVGGGNGVRSAESVCAAFPGLRDTRCENASAYDGAMVYSYANNWSVERIPVLVPKSVGVSNADILKIRIDGNRPAIFELLAAKGSKDPTCYYHGAYGPHTGGAGGVVCPKYGWDYKRDVNVK